MCTENSVKFVSAEKFHTISKRPATFSASASSVVAYVLYQNEVFEFFFSWSDAVCVQLDRELVQVS